MSPRLKAPPFFVFALICFGFAAPSLCAKKGGSSTQTIGIGKNFLIDPNRPYVYLKFDHIGKGLQRSTDEPTSRIWLRLTNNCRLPITVVISGIPVGSPKDEVGVDDNVVADRPMLITNTKDEQKAAAKPNTPRMPDAHLPEVGSLETILPGRSVLFSVPTNHVGEGWHFEIPFSFDLPKGKGFRDPNVSLGPQMSIAYGMYDIPPNHRAELER